MPGQLSGRPFSSLVTPLHSPNFSQFKYGVIGLIIVTVKPCYTDTQGNVEIVYFNLEKIEGIFPREQSKLSVMINKSVT